MRGNDISLLGEFARHHHLELSIELHPFEGIWNLPGQDVVDVAASGISLSPERMNSQSYWSKPYSSVRRSALVRRGEKRHGYENFSTFSVVGESLAHTHALKHLPRESSLRMLSGIDEGVESLLRGETDAVGTSSVSAFHQVSKDPRLDVVDLHRYDDSPELISFSVRRDRGLVDSINEWISSSGNR